MTILFRSLLVALASAWVLAIGTAVTATQGATQPTAQAAAATAVPPGRFDMAIRADFFAGFTGDMARFDRAMTLCESVLATNPDHAEALVWHGGGLGFRGGQAFQSGDFQQGGELWGRGLAEMARAVSLQPDNIGVRIPRGAVLLEASRQMPPTQGLPLVKIAMEDYEHVLELQSAYLDKLSDHARGELLFGLAEGWARLGEKEKARDYFTRLTTSASTSGRVTYAKAWLEGVAGRRATGDGRALRWVPLNADHGNREARNHTALLVKPKLIRVSVFLCFHVSVFPCRACSAL